MQTCRVAIAGFGRVGRATASMLLARRERYRDLYGTEVALVAVVGSRAGLIDQDGIAEARFADLEAGVSGPDVIAASGADVVIDAGPSDHRTGGPGLAYLIQALAAGHDAIAISKGALVHSGAALMETARATGAMLKVSGASGAALPTIDLIEHSLKGAAILGLEGILNATTNYLLDAMMARGIELSDALAEAQAGGFAERDPRGDVEGWDTASKLVILANFGLGAPLAIDDVRVGGMEAVTSAEIAGWRRDGRVPKLVGRLSREGETWRAAVGIETYCADDPFARVPGKTKAIRIATDTMGEIVALGCGEEPVATAAAALKDLEHILAARRRARGT
ncbi:homoserine dehydrogenase [Acuticoccus sp. M5D2P5]|uniref:homoserine dehydrogenase n=1 Tax=Acuticoccus kalidii TaxID=2910977 RepID=UPI001F3F05F3|nr:homoserine dehydrogenase [Acuticoccus kalidii]MCF3935150.1 homoserine dehydrogenase [Acuticoccus kalidii]